MKQIIKVTSPKGFQITVGELKVSDKEVHFIKKVNRSKHYMRRVSGYGIQKEAFDKYLRGKKGRITIFEKDTHKMLDATIKMWEEHGSYQNFGFGKQVFLSEKYMEVL